MVEVLVVASWAGELGKIKREASFCAQRAEEFRGTATNEGGSGRVFFVRIVFLRSKDDGCSKNCVVESLPISGEKGN